MGVSKLALLITPWTAKEGVHRALAGLEPHAWDLLPESQLEISQVQDPVRAATL